MTGPDKKEPIDSDVEQTFSSTELRNARRMARRMGLNPSNGLDAVRMLEAKGIDIKSKVVADGDSTDDNNKPSALAKIEPKKLPATQNENPKLPVVVSKDERQTEIKKLEKRIKKKRNTRVRQMVRRFAMYVLLPTAATTYYLYNISTPLYASQSILSITEAKSAAAGGLEGLLSRSPLGGANIESVKVQKYIESQDAFLRLEQDYDFPSFFQGEHINRFERLADDASTQDRYKTYKKYIIPIYDSTDQMLRIEVKAPDPDTTEIVANLLIGYAEEQLDRESVGVRKDELASAQLAYDTAVEDLKIAQQDLIQIQSSQTSLSAIADVEIIMGIIGQQTVLLNEKQIALDQLLQNATPNQSRVNALKNDIKALREKIDELNEGALAENEKGDSLAKVRQQTVVAETDVATKIQLLEEQRILLQSAQAKNLEQKKYITQAYPPKASFVTIYPKKLTTSLMSFVIFFGLYLFISMTVDVIREQVSV